MIRNKNIRIIKPDVFIKKQGLKNCIGKYTKSWEATSNQRESVAKASAWRLVPLMLMTNHVHLIVSKKRENKPEAITTNTFERRKEWVLQLFKEKANTQNENDQF